MPTPTTTKRSQCNLAAKDAAERARLSAVLSGFEERLRLCRGEAQGFLEEHWDEARYRSELAYLLGQIRGLMEHCRDLEGRYRDERICLVARDAPVPGAARDRPGQPAAACGSSEAAGG
jgi:hypothetical protein